MNLIRKTIIAISILVYMVSVNGDHSAAPRSENIGHNSATLQQEFEPSHIFPAKDLYEVTEGESLIISINVIFPSLSGGCIETVTYGALPPKPAFVTLTQPFSREFKKAGSEIPYTHQMALLILAPQQGEAGEYEFQITEKLCPQSAVTFLPFKVKVSKATLSQRWIQTKRDRLSRPDH